MNTRPILDSDTGPFVLSASFNAQNSCFSVALESGFRGWSTQRPGEHDRAADLPSIFVAHMRAEDIEK